MRIGIIHPSQKLSGGGERICGYLARYLLQKGHDVTVFADQDTLAYPEMFRSMRPQVARAKYEPRILDSKLFLPYKLWLYPFFFDYSKTDLLVDTVGDSLIHASLNKKVKAFYFHFPPPAKSNLSPGIRFRQALLSYYPRGLIDRASLRVSSGMRYACNSLYIQRLVESYYGIHPEIIRPPVDTDYFTPTREPTEDFVLLTGRIVRFKKFELALQHLEGEKVVLAGQRVDGNYYAELKERYPFVQFKLDVSDPELKRLYQNCRAYVFTNWEEHFGIVPFEAMSCERKVIVPELCGASELIKDGENGFLVKKDFSDFSGKYQQLVNAGRHVGQSARATVEDHLRVTVMESGFDRLLRGYL